MHESVYKKNIRKNSPPGQSNDLLRNKDQTLVFACHLFGIDRQVYYRSLRRKARLQSKAVQVMEMIAETRRVMPRIGTRKLYYMLLDKLQALKIGRDKFFGILRANHLLVEARRSYHVTTDSHHRFRKHTNLILELPVIRPEQLWVSDITYIGKREKPCYLSLVTIKLKKPPVKTGGYGSIVYFFILP